MSFVSRRECVGRTGAWGRRLAVAGAAGALVVAPVALAGSQAGATPAHAHAKVVSAAGAWRHGLVPMFRPGAARAVPDTSLLNLQYGGGTDKVGVTTGSEKLYLVLWGSQWGTESTNSKGYDVFSGDPSGAAPYLQAFFSGLGKGGELWSGVMTQYCQGVAKGAQFCRKTAAHVAYPSGDVLAGVFEDTSAAAPAAATAHQIGVEAEAAAAHFGNKTTASNRNVQYDIVSPHGADPDSYQQNGFCAWHDFTGDTTMDGGGAVSGPLLAFTNLPYLSDAGTSCGENFVNSGSAGTLDGFSIVNGHEYAETITDQFPAGGWVDIIGEENGDLCAWMTSGAGRVQDVKFANGMFAVQGTWSNVANTRQGACAIKHAIVT